MSWCKLTWTVGEKYIVRQCGWGTFVCVTERVLKLPNLILSLQAPGYKAKYSHSDKPHLTHGPQYVLRRLENVTEGWKFAKIKGRIKKTQNKEWDQILVQIWNCKSKSKCFVSTPTKDCLFISEIHNILLSISISVLCLHGNKGLVDEQDVGLMKPRPCYASWPRFLEMTELIHICEDKIRCYYSSLSSIVTLFIIFFMLIHHFSSSVKHKRDLRQNVLHTTVDFGRWMIFYDTKLHKGQKRTISVSHKWLCMLYSKS